jgi:hypothetical protein
MVSSGREGSLSSGPSRGEDLCPSTPWLFIEGRKRGEEILELSKAIYGLKQASACFWTAMNEHLSIGFKSVVVVVCWVLHSIFGYHLSSTDLVIKDKLAIDV